MTRTSRTGRPDDEGAASVFVLGMVVVLMAVAGLVVDGGRAINARAAAMDAAEQAARSGASRIAADSLLGDGAIRLDPDAARAAAADYLVAQGYPAAGITVAANENQVTVVVRDQGPTTLLSLVMINSFGIEGHATARAALGIVGEIPVGAP